MENDKLTVRERLIDFMKWYEIKYSISFTLEDAREDVDEYLKSINESSSEALTLAPIEQKDKVCEHKYPKLVDCSVYKCNECGKLWI